jgi:hypothetical protein
MVIAYGFHHLHESSYQKLQNSSAWSEITWRTTAKWRAQGQDDCDVTVAVVLLFVVRALVRKNFVYVSVTCEVSLLFRIATPHSSCR